MEEIRGVYRGMWEKSEGKRRLGRLVMYGKIILKSISKKPVNMWTGLNWLKIGTGGGL